MTAATDRAPQVQAAYTTLIAALLRDIDALWGRIDWADLEESLTAWIAAVSAIVEVYALAAVVLEQDAYLDARESAGVEGDLDPGDADVPDADEVEETLRWATSELWRDGDPGTVHGTVDSAVEKLVLDTGRQATETVAELDADVVAWARYAGPTACAWCASIASRGFVFRSRESATFKAEGGRYHTNCKCLAAPQFRGESPELPAHIRAWEELWKDSTGGYSGSKDKLNAFRRAIYAQTH